MQYKSGLAAVSDNKLSAYFFLVFPSLIGVFRRLPPPPLNNTNTHTNTIYLYVVATGGIMFVPG